VAQVVVQPSFGNVDAQRHWADTIAQEASLTDTDLRATLSPDQITALEALHPTGRARFWGSVSGHDTRMDGLATGDIVLFTGKKHVRGIGEVGVSFRNARTADTRVAVCAWPSDSLPTSAATSPSRSAMRTPTP